MPSLFMVLSLTKQNTKKPLQTKRFKFFLVICDEDIFNTDKVHFQAGFNYAYASTGAPVGHTPAQAPQSMQVSASITKIPSPSLIAPVGHSASQAPQAMQLSPIL